MRQTILLLFLSIIFSCSNNGRSKESTNSSKNFPPSTYNFNGNYIPINEIKIKDHLLKSIEISVIESHKKFKIDLIYIRFIDLRTDEYYVITNTSFSGDKNNIKIISNDPLLGELEISGCFVGDLSPQQKDISSTEEVIFKGRIKIDGLNEYALDCKFFEGD